MSSTVDAYIQKATKGQEEITTLRSILLVCDLTEDIKWGKPYYMFEEMNIVIIRIKEYCTLLFFKGALLKEPKKVLVKTVENTQVGRQIRFANDPEITKLKAILKAYIYEAVELVEAGLKVIIKKNPKPIPEELQEKFEYMPSLKKAFGALAPRRQRAYIYYFSAPKQSKTKVSRIEKYIDQILDGRGLND